MYSSSYLTKEQRKRLVSDMEYLLNGQNSLNSVSDELNAAALRVFHSYMEDYENTTVSVNGFDKKSGTYGDFEFKLKNRWVESYKRRTLAKFYNLDKWYASNGRPPVTMVTLTTKQRGITILEQIRLLGESRNKLLDLIRHRRSDKINYVYVLEPHKSGFAHCHILFFNLFGSAEVNHYRDIWNKKYGAGGFKNAIKFDRSTRVNSLKNVKNYMMKYLQKTLSGDFTDKGYSLFSAWVHYATRKDTKGSGVRFYGCSRTLSSFMKLDDVKNFIVNFVELVNGNERSVIYENPNFKTIIGDMIMFYSSAVGVR